MVTRKTYEFGDFRLDPARRWVARKNGEAVALNAKPFDALVYLVEHAGEPVSRKTLTEALWPNRVVEENNLAQAISAVRRAIGDGYIATLAGRGYQFVGEVRSVDLHSDAAPAAPTHGARETGAAQPVAATPTDSAALASARRFRASRSTAIAAGIVLSMLVVWGYFRMKTAQDEAAAAVEVEPVVKLLVLPFASRSSDPEQLEFVGVQRVRIAA